MYQAYGKEQFREQFHLIKCGNLKNSYNCYSNTKFFMVTGYWNWKEVEYRA